MGINRLKVSSAMTTALLETVNYRHEGSLCGSYRFLLSVIQFISLYDLF